MAKQEDTAPENGKAARNAPAPVIRKLVVAEEDAHTRLMKRQVPAWVISGLIHVVLIAAFIIFDRMTHKDAVAKVPEAPTSTKIDEKAEKDPDLTNPDLGLDSELAAAVEVDKESDFNVEAPAVENEAPGLPNQEKDFASQTSQLGPMNQSLAEAGSMSADLGGATAAGAGGGGSDLAMPGLQGRSGATKEKNLRNGGGNDQTEAAVARALVWLAKQQNVGGGFWEYDGSSKPDRVAATGMCLLPFLAAGETHKTGKRYKDTVARGLNFLKAQIKPSGQFGDAGMYSQAIATVAICEAAGMTRDETLKKVARMAVDYVLKAQAEDGSWGYTPNTQGDTSIVGWQIQALKSAKLAGIPIPPKAFERAQMFLASVSDDSGATYGYRTKGKTAALSAVGLLSQQYMGWTPRNGSLARGVDFLWNQYPPKETEWDMYYYYYATQVVHFFDGPVWHRDWNPKIRGILINKQITEKTPGSKVGDIGSYPKDNGHIGGSCGKLGTTALACLTLEVYYRHLPLYKRDNGGAVAE